MQKKSQLNPTRTRTGRRKAPPALPARASARARTPTKLTRAEALEIGRTPRELRKAWRRMLQKRRIAQRQRDKKKAALLAQRRLASVPTWPLPPEPEPQQRDDPTVAEAEEQPRSSPRPERAPPAPRRAVRAEPEGHDRVHGPNRGGESARSWTPAGERNPTRVPLDVSEIFDWEN